MSAPDVFRHVEPRMLPDSVSIILKIFIYFNRVMPGCAQAGGGAACQPVLQDNMQIPGMILLSRKERNNDSYYAGW